MRILVFFVLVFFYSFQISSSEIKIINLHSGNKQDNEITLTVDDDISDIIKETNAIESDGEFISEDISEDTINDSSETINEDDQEEINTDENPEILTSEENQISSLSSDEVITVDSFWETSNKEDLDFLFNNIKINNSKTLSDLLVDNLQQTLAAPSFYEQKDFDYLRIKTLIKLGQKPKALSFLKNISTYNDYKNYYDFLNLDYLFTTNDISEACDFNESMQNSNVEKNNLVLKINIFCNFARNQVEKADFLNSLLIDLNDNDEYFQQIYLSLKNNSTDLISLSDESFFENDQLALYSAMLRLGNLPLNQKLLEFDPTNLSLPIILSPSTDISLRLKAAHKAYEIGIIDAESLSALYRSVDFSNDQLNNSKQSITDLNGNKELIMALLFQKSNIQLLPITRLDSLTEFWNYSKKIGFEKMSYDVSKDLIKNINPSEELAEYSLDIARANIHNNDFDIAEKWILFAENYLIDDQNFDNNNLKSVKLLYNLKTSISNQDFIKVIIENKLFEIKNDHVFQDEILNTIIQVIIEEKNISIQLEENKKLFDNRSMPSSFLIEKIKNSAEKNNISELILSSHISINDKKWQEIHPYHLKILIKSIMKTDLDNVFKELIIEILEESKII